MTEDEFDDALQDFAELDVEAQGAILRSAGWKEYVCNPSGDVPDFSNITMEFSEPTIVEKEKTVRKFTYKDLTPIKAVFRCARCNAHVSVPCSENHEPEFAPYCPYCGCIMNTFGTRYNDPDGNEHFESFLIALPPDVKEIDVPSRSESAQVDP